VNFIAAGEREAIGFWLLGDGRGRITVPPYGDLLIDLSLPYLVTPPLGTFDARGTLQWSVTMPPSGGRIYAQMLRLTSTTVVPGGRATVEFH